ncbi:MAG: branched-chain amino acid aminotransferase [Saprospiraceae bacterium]|jgi:branched-chain amino acid aminotransferase
MSDLKQGAAYVDGQIRPIHDAKISLLDWGFLHSDATYDVVHVWQGRFFRLDDHLDRFYAGMDKLRMTLSVSRGELKKLLNDCVSATGLQDAYVEMICTRGQPQPGSRDPRTCENKLFAFAIPFVWVATPEQQEKGLSMIISHQQRIPPASLDPTIKNYHWLDLVMGQFEAFDNNAQTAVVVDGEGNVVEGPGFNIFVVKGAQVATPKVGVLRGITRKTAIELTTELKLESEQRAISVKEVLNADEVFITSTAGGVMAVTEIDGLPVGKGPRAGKSGPITHQFKQAYWALHDESSYNTPVRYK